MQYWPPLASAYLAYLSHVNALVKCIFHFCASLLSSRMTLSFFFKLGSFNISPFLLTLTCHRAPFHAEIFLAPSQFIQLLLQVQGKQDMFTLSHLCTKSESNQVVGFTIGQSALKSIKTKIPENNNKCKLKITNAHTIKHLKIFFRKRYSPHFL